MYPHGKSSRQVEFWKANCLSYTRRLCPDSFEEIGGQAPHPPANHDHFGAKVVDEVTLDEVERIAI